MLFDPNFGQNAPGLQRTRFFGCGPFERASKIIGMKTLDGSFGGLEPEISLSKGGPGVPTGGPPLEPIWRPMVTWRRYFAPHRHAIDNYGTGGGQSDPAPVLATGGKPSTRLPPGRLVEQAEHKRNLTRIKYEHILTKDRCLNHIMKIVQKWARLRNRFSL